MILQEEAQSIHAQCVAAGWWDEYPNRMDRFDTAMALVLSELMEGLEGWRKDLMDDHLPHYKMYHVELADAAIRLLDSAAAWNIPVDDIDFGDTWDFAKTAVPDRLMETCRNAASLIPHVAIHNTLLAVITLARYENIDLAQIISEKRIYNANRADHKKENRAAKNGKRI